MVSRGTNTVVPPNLIPPGATMITPDQLPLIDLVQPDIDRIVTTVPGGVPNVQDIYALSPAQEDIFFHHLFTGGGADVLIDQIVFADRRRLDAYLDAAERVVERHDVLRTSFVWEGLARPAQVVWHTARLQIEGGQPRANSGEARRFDPRRHQIDLTRAPLWHLVIEKEPDGERWLATELMHRLVGDQSTLEIVHAEVDALLRGEELQAPLQYRSLVAHTRLGRGAEGHKRFFEHMLRDVDEPTAPFGLTEVHRDAGIAESRVTLSTSLNTQLRERAGRLGVSLASLCHVAWAHVMARASDRDHVVFGTVLRSSRADRAIGQYSNVLPIRLNRDDLGVEVTVQQTHALLAELLLHEHASLALAQRCSGIAPGLPLFSALLTYRKRRAPTDGEEEAEWRGVDEHMNFPIVLSVEDFGNALGLTAQVVQPVSPARVCAMIERGLEQLADALERRPSMPVRMIDTLPVAERTLLLDTWNATQAPYPSAQCIHSLFEQQVARTPDAIAVVQGDAALTYAELNAQANQLAHRLIRFGICPGHLVGLCVERRPHLVIGVLAVLKAGGAYVPLDPSHPRERVRELLSDAAPELVLADEAGRQALGEDKARVVPIDDPTAWAEERELNPCVPGLSSRHLLYVIYTSGSTGTPKGVMVEHQAVVNRLVWMQNAYGLDATDMVLQKTPYGFDVSAWEIFWTLLYGSTMVLAAPDGHRDTAYLVELIQKRGVTTVHFVPSMLSGFLDAPGVEHCTSLRRVICSGESLPAATVVACRRALPAAQLHNLYGPTEAAIDVTSWRCPDDFSGHTVSIGRPIANTQIYLLDANGQPAPIGVLGELYIGGAGVARGYLRRPALTAERFVPDPFGRAPGARMYRTGDLARYLPDGNLEFLGRNDHQVKIRGNRIEVGEIEARLAKHPVVREVVVIAREYAAAGQTLVAYVTTAESDVEDLASKLREYLAGQLPEYMVPPVYVPLEALPLTKNGKLDRGALPSPSSLRTATRARDETPPTSLEQELMHLWTEMLGVPVTSTASNFFELGGHSLLLVRLANRLRAMFGLDLQLRVLFDTSTISRLAREIADRLAALAQNDELADLLTQIEAMSPEEAQGLLDRPD